MVKPKFGKGLGKVLKGLGLLIYIDALWTAYQGLPEVVPQVLGSVKEKSDYSRPFFSDGRDISEIIDYLFETANEHLNAARLYLPLLSGDMQAVIDYFIDKGEGGPPPILTDIKKYFGYQIPLVKKIEFIGVTRLIEEFTLDDVSRLLRIDDRLYRGLAVVATWDFPVEITFKTIQPGEQVTGSFHKEVLDDKSVWYKNQFYTV